CQMFREYGATDNQVSSILRTAELARAYALARDDEKRRLGAIRGRRVFVVHGRDESARKQLESALERLDLKPIVIMNEPCQGRTIIEQIEEHSDVGFAFVLFTPDDSGSLLNAGRLQPRPRQNVVFEYGLFVGWLGRHRVCCIASDSSIELPSDLAGVLQLRYETSIDEVKAGIRRELSGAGYTFASSGESVG
ncbi:MAG: TIR domain-containing protein, partial [Candidatus Saccharimonadales bacterium]